MPRGNGTGPGGQGRGTKGKAEAGDEWVSRLPLGQAVIAFAQVAELQSHILQASHVVKRPALNVEQ